VNYKNCHIDFSSSIHYSWESFRYYLFLNSFSTENLLSKSITSFSMKESETKNPASYNLKNDIQSAIDYVNKKKMDKDLAILIQYKKHSGLKRGYIIDLKKKIAFDSFMVSHG